MEMLGSLGITWGGKCCVHKLDVSHVETPQRFYTQGVIPVLRCSNVAFKIEVWMAEVFF